MATLPFSRVAPPVRDAIFIALASAILTALIVFALVGDVALAAGFLAAGLLLLAGVAVWRQLAAPEAKAESEPDWSVARAVAQAADDAVAITDRAGRLVCANDRYEALFGGFPMPPRLPLESSQVEEVTRLGRAAWLDGFAVASVEQDARPLAISVARAGEAQDMLVWRFAISEARPALEAVRSALPGPVGERLGEAGIMVALIEPEGRILVANPRLRARATGRQEGGLEGSDLAQLLVTDAEGRLRFARERAGNPLRLVRIPFLESDEAPLLIALLDEEPASIKAVPGEVSHIHALIGLIPVGMALVDRDGRFQQLNEAFIRAAAIDPAAPPLYPGDLVIREDKAAVADAVRRMTMGTGHSTDCAVRLKGRPDEPVALTIAAAHGLGDAAVLLSLKDNSEESRLKREVAQATKMQAVGQLAGGVAHDFNNILTAIIGHCDLMLMRHSPGDSDYDDIQQIRTNSNRAASLTRQLLAFSRQQTLRPQVLQLPDIISEVSNLLKRLLGETVALEVHHGRDLGPVRADPGQLEQVVVNLAVNARDAMLAANPRGGGTLTIRTRGVSALEAGKLGGEIMPPAEYTALEVADTGAGIPADILSKIFEPFFTTKDVGKGTGLGLSTVYGIVKQSGGYIFAESPPGRGAVFTMYLPVNAISAPRRAKAPRQRPADLWGTGTILLVEDEDMVRSVAERALTRQGYTVLSAENGEVALELLDTHPRPDLLVSDVVMPAMDGPTMARRIRERYADIPILFMSGYAEEQLRRSIDLDRVSFLPKPFSVQQLAEAARDALTG